MRFELDDYNRGLPDEELLADLRRVADKLGKDSVTTSEYTDHGRCHSSTLQKRFGSWFSALDKAGLKRTRILGITDEELIADLKQIAELLGKDSVTISEYADHGRHSPSAMRYHFSSWFSALDAADLRRTRNLGITEEELFENLENIWIRLGRQPTYGEIRTPLSRFSAGTYEGRFGTWRKALEAFVRYANCESDAQSAQTPQDGTPISGDELDNHRTSSQEMLLAKDSGRQTRRSVSHRLRFLVFRRDGFKCLMCGKSPANHLGVELVVDHVTPWSKGGETTLDNLQTLCVQCNSGKSNLSQ